MSRPARAEPKTLAQALRQIERLQAQLAEKEAFIQRVRDGERERVYEVVDLRMRNQQAAAILAGED
jgi:hypothetical protein